MRTVLCRGAVGLLMALPVAAVAAEAQERPEPKAPMVRTLGCVEQRGAEWWLTRAAEAERDSQGVFDATEVAETQAEVSLGSTEYLLVGVTDFLTPEGLLRTGDRALFTTPDQVNATGDIRAGRLVLVKGLLIRSLDPVRINLTAVVGLTGDCS